MTQFYAQPYDMMAKGFFFESYTEFTDKASQNLNACGDLVEEYEIQFIDGAEIDCALANAVGINQANIRSFIKISALWDYDDKLRYILAVGECGYDFDITTDDPNDLEVDIYHLDSLRDLAIEFVEEGIMGDIPEALIMYFDYDALARDLAVDYTETTIAGQRLIYRCA